MKITTLFSLEHMMMALYRFLYFFTLLLCFFLNACKTEVIKPIPEIQGVEIQQVRDNKIALRYSLSTYGYTETGVKFYEKENPSKTITVKAIRNGDQFYVELLHLTASTAYVFQPYYIMDGKVELSVQTHEVMTTSKFPNQFTINWIAEEIRYSDLGEFQLSFEGEKLHNVNLKDLNFYLNGKELHKSFPVKQVNGKYKITVSGRFMLGYDSKQTIVIGFEDNEILRQDIDFKYAGEMIEMVVKPTNILSRYFVSVNDQFYNFEVSKVSTFNELNNRFEEIASIPYWVGNLVKSSVVVGDKIFFLNQLYSHISPNEHNNGNEIYSQSFDLKKKEFMVYYYGKHNWSTAHNYEHGAVFMHKGVLYQAYTIFDYVNGMPTMPVPQVKNYVARYNPTKDAIEDFTTFSNSLSEFKFISLNNILYAFALKDIVIQGYVIGKTLAFYKVNPHNFEFEEVIQIGDEYSPFSYAPKNIVEYNGKLLLTFNSNYHVLYDVSTNTSQQLYMRTPILNMYFHDIIKHKGKYYLFADHNSTSGAVYEIETK